jgi:hypothetical protein
VKKTVAVTVVMVALSVAALIAAQPYTKGWGSKVTASTVTARIAQLSLNELSIENRGLVDARCLVNCTTNEFNMALTNTTEGTLMAIPIAAGSIYTFSSEAHGVIRQFCYATTNSTADLYLGGY